MFEPLRYKASLRKMDSLAQPVNIKVNNGTGFTTYSNVRMHVSRYQENELIAGGSIMMGDLRLIIPAENLPDVSMKLEMKDRVEIDGRVYSVIQWDNYTRKMGEELIAVEAAVRG